MVSSVAPPSAAARVRGHRSTVLDAASPLPQSLLRLRGGTYSPTVSRLFFADGSTARADLISLTPDVDAYSVQPDGVSPPQRALYRALGWGSGIAALGSVRADGAGAGAGAGGGAGSGVARRLRHVEREIAAILTGSYPALDLAELSRRVRAAGGALGRADLREHEAIGATQAALWHVTDGLTLRERSLAQPVSAELWNGTSRVALPTARPGVRAPLAPAAHQSITLHLPQAPALDSYSFTLVPHSARLSGTVHLEASRDGVIWHEVPSSRASLERHAAPTLEGWRVVKGLGSGATVREALGTRLAGYPWYRLVLRGAPAGALEHLVVHAATCDRGNAPAVVVLYRYLLSLLETPDLGQRAPDGVAPESAAPHAALLLGSRVRGGAPEFTTLALAVAPAAPVIDRTSAVRAAAVRSMTVPFAPRSAEVRPLEARELEVAALAG